MHQRRIIPQLATHEVLISLLRIANAPDDCYFATAPLQKAPQSRSRGFTTRQPTYLMTRLLFKCTFCCQSLHAAATGQTLLVKILRFISLFTYIIFAAISRYFSRPAAYSHIARDGITP